MDHFDPVLMPEPVFMARGLEYAGWLGLDDVPSLEPLVMGGWSV